MFPEQLLPIIILKVFSLGTWYVVGVNSSFGHILNARVSCLKHKLKKNHPRKTVTITTSIFTLLFLIFSIYMSSGKNIEVAQLFSCKLHGWNSGFWKFVCANV